MYFYLHIISLLIILFLPIKPHAHIQRQPQTLNSVNKKQKDWYLQGSPASKTARCQKEEIKGSRVRQGLRSDVYMHFFFKSREYFIKPFIWVSQPRPVDLIFLRTFEWCGVTWRRRQCCRDRPCWAAGSLLFGHDLQPLEPGHLLQKAEGGCWQSLSSRTYADTVVSWEAPDPLTTGTAQKSMEERDPARRSQEDLPWTLEWTESQACPEVGCIFLSPRDRTLPFFLWTEPRLEIRKSPVHVPQESRKGYCFPFHMRRLPCPGMALRKHPNVCIIRGSRMSFK